MTTAVTPRTIVTTLETIQREFPVFHWQIAGVHIWPLARMRWIFGVWSAAFSSQAEGVPTVGGQRLRAVYDGMRNCARARRSDKKAEDRLGPKRDLVFLSDGISFASIGETKFERFCDPLIEHAHEAGLTTQMWTPLHLYLTPRATPSLFIQPAVDRANARAVLQFRLKKPTVQVAEWDGVKAWLAARSLDTPALDLGRLARDAVRILRVCDLYSRWLSRVRPRAAFVVCYYSLEAMAFVRACRRYGIPVTDLQHGVQGEGHGAYAGWGHIPAGSDELLPDNFWVWSKWEADAIDAGLITQGVCRPIVGGNPWMEFWDADPRPEMNSALAEARALLAEARGRPTVLVTLQFGLADELQLMPLRRLIDLSGGKYAWWVRLHPAMAQRREEVRAKLGTRHPESVWLDVPSDLPLPAFLPFVRVHLTHSSSTVIESASCGVPSIVTSESGRELYGPYIERGSVLVELGGAAELEATLDSLTIADRADSGTLGPNVRARYLQRAFDEVVGRAQQSPSSLRR